MERDRLFGGGVEAELHLKEIKKEAAKPKGIDKRREERRKPFIEVRDRNDDIIRAVHEITASAEEIEYVGTKRKKIVVVMGKHPVTEITPDHVAVCGVTYIDNNGQDTAQVRSGATAEFAFALVPISLIEHFVEDPHDLHNPRRRDVVRFTPEETMSAQSISRRMNSLIGDGNGGFIAARKRSVALEGLNQYTLKMENNLQMVAEVITHAELNPHLGLHKTIQSPIEQI